MKTMQIHLLADIYSESATCVRLSFHSQNPYDAHQYNIKFISTNYSSRLFVSIDDCLFEQAATMNPGARQTSGDSSNCGPMARVFRSLARYSSHCESNLML